MFFTSRKPETFHLVDCGIGCHPCGSSVFALNSSTTQQKCKRKREITLQILVNSSKQANMSQFGSLSRGLQYTINYNNITVLFPL